MRVLKQWRVGTEVLLLEHHTIRGRYQLTDSDGTLLWTKCNVLDFGCDAMVRLKNGILVGRLQVSVSFTLTTYRYRLLNTDGDVVACEDAPHRYAQL